MDAAALLLKRAFCIDEVLFTIYGFLLGTDMNTNVIMMKLRLVSSRFNNLFISFMRSIPLQLKYTPREGPIVKWLNSYDIATLFKLNVNIEEEDIHAFREDFYGLDLSNLQVLDLSISSTSGFRVNVQDVFFSFAQATSLTSLKLLYHNRNEFVVPITVFDYFLFYFPVLNSLDVSIGDYDNTSTKLAYPKKLEHLVLHKLIGQNLAFRSESVKILDVSDCFLDSIISIDCPSLEKMICQATSLTNSPVRIAGMSADTLVEQFGNTDKEFITDYLQSNTHYINSSDIESITSISVVPMDYITGNYTTIKVKNDCVLVLFACYGYPQDNVW